MFLLAERSCGVVVILIPYLARENPPSCLHPAASTQLGVAGFTPAKSRTPGYPHIPYRALSFQRLGRRNLSCKLPFCRGEMASRAKAKCQAGTCTACSELTQLFSPPTAVALLLWGAFDRVVCQCQKVGDNSCVALG